MKKTTKKIAKVLLLTVCFGMLTASMNLHAANVPTNFVTFDKSNITTGKDANRAWTISGEGTIQTLEFSTADGQKLFSGAGNSQCDFYGGAKFTYQTTPLHDWRFLLGAPGDYFKAFHGDSDNSTLSSRMDFLFLWRKDQFTGTPTNASLFDATTNSKISIDIIKNGGNWDMPGATRFVIKNGSQYYISEYVSNLPWGDGEGVKTLETFNNSSEVGKRWGVFNPVANDFSIPTILPEFLAVDFNHVVEVGLIYSSTRTQYGQQFEFGNFTVNGIIVDTPTGISDLNKIDARVFNNNGHIVIDLTALKGASSVSVIDTKGSVIKTIESAGSDVMNIKVANKGVYLVRVQNAGKTSTVKVVL